MAEADEPKRCPCGFWGSASTMNLCSKCYKEYQKTHSSGRGDSAAGANISSEKAAAAGLLSNLLSDVPEVATSSQRSEEEEKRDDQPETNKEEPLVNLLPSSIPVQTNKKRCWRCKCRLELAQRELGTCKCGYTFCLLHRLPEQHSCVYDHREGGRRQDLKNMVPTGKKKIGRSFHRMDSRND